MLGFFKDTLISSACEARVAQNGAVGLIRKRGSGRGWASHGRQTISMALGDEESAYAPYLGSIYPHEKGLPRMATLFQIGMLLSAISLLKKVFSH